MGEKSVSGEAFGSCGAWPGNCGEVNEIGVTGTASVGRNMLENECGD